MRQFMKLPMAMVLSAFVFGAYHENSVQTFYAFVLGFLLAYGYEYFGNFYVPVAMHMGANIVAYCLTRSGLVTYRLCKLAGMYRLRGSSCRVLLYADQAEENPEIEGIKALIFV